MLYFFSDLVGFVYPVYASIKAIETADNKEDDTFWLTYWLVFALFKVVENIADVLISSIPFYFFLKIGFLYWCFSSQFQVREFNSMMMTSLINLPGIRALSLCTSS